MPHNIDTHTHSLTLVVILHGVSSMTLAAYQGWLLRAISWDADRGARAQTKIPLCLGKEPSRRVDDIDSFAELAMGDVNDAHTLYLS